MSDLDAPLVAATPISQMSGRTCPATLLAAGKVVQVSMNKEQKRGNGTASFASELIGIGKSHLHFDEKVARHLTGHLDDMSTFAQRRHGLDELTSVWELLALDRQLEVAGALVEFIFKYASRVGGECTKERQGAAGRGRMLEDYARSQAAPASAASKSPWSIMLGNMTPH